MRWIAVMLLAVACVGPPDRAGLGVSHSEYSALGRPSGATIDGEGQTVGAWVEWDLGPQADDLLVEEVRRFGDLLMLQQRPVVHEVIVPALEGGPKAPVGSWITQFDTYGVVSKLVILAAFLALLWICRKQIRGWAGKWLPSVTFNGKKRKGK